MPHLQYPLCILQMQQSDNLCTRASQGNLFLSLSTLMSTFVLFPLCSLSYLPIKSIRSLFETDGLVAELVFPNGRFKAPRSPRRILLITPQLSWWDSLERVTVYSARWFHMASIWSPVKSMLKLLLQRCWSLHMFAAAQNWRRWRFSSVGRGKAPCIQVNVSLSLLSQA